MVVIFSVADTDRRKKYRLIFPDRVQKALVQTIGILLSFISLFIVIYIESFIREIRPYVILFKEGISEMHYPIKYSFFTLRQSINWIGGISPVSIKRSKSHYTVWTDQGEIINTKHIYLNNYPLLDLAYLCDFDIKLVAQIKVNNNSWWQYALNIKENGVYLDENLNVPAITEGFYPIHHNVMITRVFMGLLTLK